MNNIQANCKFYGSMIGCRYGNSCIYSHSNPNSVSLCHFYNNCRYGNSCRFRHTNFNIRNNIINNGNVQLNPIIHQQRATAQASNADIVKDFVNLHIIPSDYLDTILDSVVAGNEIMLLQILNSAIANHEMKQARIHHVMYLLKKHLTEPVSKTLAETLVSSITYDDEVKQIPFDLNELKLLDMSVRFTVFGFCRNIEKELLAVHDYNSYYNIPELVNQCVIYYYHSMKPKEFESKCTDCDYQWYDK